MADRWVFEVDTIRPEDEMPVRIGVDYEEVSVRIGPSEVTLNHYESESFARAFVHATWLAGRQAGLRDAETPDA